MEQINILNTKIQKLFTEQSKEPVLVKNQTGNHFLVLPLQQINWQDLFFHLYQLPNDLFKENCEQKRDMSKIDKICGSYKNSLSSSEEFAQNKQEEIDLEERKWRK